MLKVRIIPILLLKGNSLVKSVNFKIIESLGMQCQLLRFLVRDLQMRW